MDGSNYQKIIKIKIVIKKQTEVLIRRFFG